MHCLIVAPPGIGKSTLIRRVLQEVDRPAFGYLTRKEKDMWDEELGHPIYIYAVGEISERSQENLVGHCKDRRPVVYGEAFDRFAPRLAEPIPTGGVVVMDEIGFMESASPAFCGEILRLLDGDIPVIAAVKDKETKFLDRIRTHPKARCFYLTPENREEIYRAVLNELQKGYE